MASRPQLPELDYELMRADEILGALLDAFPGRVSLACSFQKEESVLLDMLAGLDRPARLVRRGDGVRHERTGLVDLLDPRRRVAPEEGDDPDAVLQADGEPLRRVPVQDEVDAERPVRQVG